MHDSRALFTLLLDTTPPRRDLGEFSRSLHDLKLAPATLVHAIASGNGANPILRASLRAAAVARDISWEKPSEANMAIGAGGMTDPSSSTTGQSSDMELVKPEASIPEAAVPAVASRNVDDPASPEGKDKSSKLPKWMRFGHKK